MTRKTGFSLVLAGCSLIVYLCIAGCGSTPQLMKDAVDKQTFNTDIYWSNRSINNPFLTSYYESSLTWCAADSTHTTAAFASALSRDRAADSLGIHHNSQWYIDKRDFLEKMLHTISLTAKF